MAFSLFKTRSHFIFRLKRTSSIHPIRCSPGIRNRFLFVFTRPMSLLGLEATSRNILNFESTCITQLAVTNEIQFYRDSRNHFTTMCFSESAGNYGPPLAIILPWNGIDEIVLKSIIEFYCENGFDALTVRLTPEQLLYPCVAGNAMNVVTELLKYLNKMQRHRPYIFHGFSIGVYAFGEIMAQFSEQYEVYRKITNNLKGCLWDSPVDFLCVRDQVGKFLHPKNFLQRVRCNMAVKRHFKKHFDDSVAYWLRSRDYFANPLVKVPNVFFISNTDLLSNPNSLQYVQKTLECNGIPIFQKTWCNSEHGHHFKKYCYEYMRGMVLFFNLSDLFPDECGKYKSSFANASLTNLRLRKATKENLCAFIDQ